MKRVAILLHLSSTRMLGEFRAAFQHINAEKDLFINLVDSGDSPAQLAEQLVRINKELDDAAIIYSDGRGEEIGGLFRLLEEIHGIPYQAILFVHDQLPSDKRRSMLRALATNSAEYIDLICEQSDSPMGLIGRKLFPYDYQKLNAYLRLVDRLGIKLQTDWQYLKRRYPEVVEMDVMQRTRWAVSRRVKAGRPELDIEYARAVLGDDLETADEHERTEIERRLIAHGVMGPLPWFPDFCFWINPGIVSLLGRQVDYANEYTALPNGDSNWLSHTARAPAWARVLPVFAIKNNYLIAEID